MDIPKKQILILVLTWIMGPFYISATRYTVIEMKPKVVKIGNKPLKVGDSFTDKDITSIVWQSDDQWIKVRNEDKQSLQYFKKTIIEKSDESSFLSRLTTYLTRRKSLATREFGIGVEEEKKQEETDTVWTIELRDKITFDVIGISKYPESTIYRAVWKEENINTPLEISEDRGSLYLTRDIFGQKEPRPAEFVIEKYELIDNKKEEAEELGTLIILPVPLEY